MTVYLISCGIFVRGFVDFCELFFSYAYKEIITFFDSEHLKIIGRFSREISATTHFQDILSDTDY